MKTFELEGKTGTIELAINEKITDKSVRVDVKINGDLFIENTVGKIRFTDTYTCIEIKKNDKPYHIIIHDPKKENRRDTDSVRHNRAIVDWLWKNIQDSDYLGTLYCHTTDHYINYEAE